jgi:FtsZ-binding cell division protein ZapB
MSQQEDARQEMIDKMAERIVDDMDMSCLLQMAVEVVEDNLQELSQEELVRQYYELFGG